MALGRRALPRLPRSAETMGFPDTLRSLEIREGERVSGIEKDTLGVY